MAVAILLLGAVIGFAGSTFGAVIVDSLALRRQTRVEILRDLMADLFTGMRQIEEARTTPRKFTRALAELRARAPLLSAREQKPVLVMVEAHEWLEHYNDITESDPTPKLEILEADLGAALSEVERLRVQLSAAPWTPTRWRGWRAPSLLQGWRPPSAENDRDARKSRQHV